MARVGETIVNSVTGEEITWRRLDADILEFDDLYTRPGHRAVAHVHPRMTEEWTVIEGRAGFRIGDDAERILSPGESVTAPAGVPHAAWNAAARPTRLRVTMTPPRRWVEIVEKLFGWANEGRTDEIGTPDPELLIGLLRDYSDELAPP